MDSFVPAIFVKSEQIGDCQPFMQH